MNDPNRTLKWTLVVALVALSIIVLYPPNRKLKGGIDLVGGTSLLFEIDTTGLADTSQVRELSTRIMNVLKQRVDPQSQLNLEWRPIGHTRLEIRMPRPPLAAIKRREAKEVALARLDAMGIRRFDVESVLNKPDGERSAAIQSLVRGVPERVELLKSVETAYLAQRAAGAQGDAQATQAATETYEKSMADLLATSMATLRLRDTLGLPKGPKRDEELARLRSQYPSYDADAEGKGGAITAALKTYDSWAADKSDLEDPSDLKRRIRGAGVLEFRILADRDPASPNKISHSNPALQQSIDTYKDQLAKYGPRPKSGDRYRWFPIENVQGFLNLKDLSELETLKDTPGLPVVEEYAGRYFVLSHNDPEFGLLRGGSGGRRWSLQRAFGTQDPMSGQNVVSFKLDTRGGSFFRELTGSNVNRQLCIMLDDSAMSHATIREAIGEHGQISGTFTEDKVADLVRTLEAGSLPARLKETPLAEKTIGPSLGQTNRVRGITASLWGAGLVVAFVVFYYGFAGGGGTILALFLNLLITLGIMALMQATFTLPGIAGLLLSIGMAIDANVLIFERIREERARGVVFKKALLLGYDKAFSAILDGNITTLITCIILGFVGSEEIKGFAITLGIGIATSMFTALTVTRLIYTSLVDVGVLRDFSMRKLIGVPAVDWIALRRVFWPLSVSMVVGGMGLFIYLSSVRTDSFFDIEFLGGTGVQIDLKPEFPMTDEEVDAAIKGAGTTTPSAIGWLSRAAEQLTAARAADGDSPSQFTLSSNELTGDQLITLTRSRLESDIDRNGFTSSGTVAIYASKPGALTLDSFKQKVAAAAGDAQRAVDRLRSARVQSVSEIGESPQGGRSYEVVTTETNRGIVQAALIAALGDKLAIQRAINFTTTTDEELTKESFFVIEGDDQYLSDVIKTDANYDIRAYRGGVAIDAVLPAAEEPFSVKEFEERLRQIGLQPEFEQFRTRESKVYPLGPSLVRRDGQTGYRRFAVCSVDDTLHYDEDTVQWTDQLARTQLGQVQAALGSERSLSKVVQFAPQIAGQTTNRAILATVLAIMGIGAYVWFRFGTRDFGLAVLVTVVHDVALVLGAIAVSHWIHDTFIGRLLLIDDFRFDLTMLAAVLTIIGYQLNDTIVVFDRIRENRGRAGTLSAALINSSINQTMSRTILTATLVSLTVIVLYLFGGAGIHGFAYAMLVGTLAGTYSTVMVAVPLIYRPGVLRMLVWMIVAIGLVGLVVLAVPNLAAKLILIGVVVGACGFALSRSIRAVGLERTAETVAA